MTTPVLCRGMDSNGDVLSMSLSTSGAMNIASASALDVSGSSISVSNLPATQAVSAVSLPLPSGASTSGLQTTGNTAITTMSGKLPASLGSKTSATSLSITMSSDEPAIDVNSVIASVSSEASLTILAGASDTTTFKDTAGYTSVGVIATSTQTDTKVGLEWSHDNSTYYAVEQGLTIPSVIGLGATENVSYFKVGVLAKYVRVHIKATTACSSKVLINLA